MTIGADKSTEKEIQAIEGIRLFIDKMRQEHQQLGNFPIAELQKYRDLLVEQIKPVMNYILLLKKQSTQNNSTNSAASTASAS